MPDPLTIVERNVSAHRFQIIDDPLAFLQYADDRIKLIRPKCLHLRGHGHASALAHAALEYAAKHTCASNQFVRSCAPTLHGIRHHKRSCDMANSMIGDIHKAATWSIVLSVLMIATGVLAISVPMIAGIAVTALVGWLLIFSGLLHLAF